jgi:hypothetical protein
MGYLQRVWVKLQVVLAPLKGSIKMTRLNTSRSSAVPQYMQKMFTLVSNGRLSPSHLWLVVLPSYHGAT